MSLHRRNPRRDANESDIVAALKRIGARCFRVSGAGLPDLLVYFRGQWTPIEIKMPGKELTTAQIGVRAVAWYPVVENEREALALFGARC